jgi:hypothetical protein
LVIIKARNQISLCLLSSWCTPFWLSQASQKAITKTVPKRKLITESSFHRSGKRRAKGIVGSAFSKTSESFSILCTDSLHKSEPLNWMPNLFHIIGKTHKTMSVWHSYFVRTGLYPIISCSLESIFLNVAYLSCSLFFHCSLELIPDSARFILTWVPIHTYPSNVTNFQPLEKTTRLTQTCSDQPLKL